jgi:hypothetical protein
MISFIYLLYSYQRFSQYFIVRFGIYSGVILSLQYAILLMITFVETGLGFCALVCIISCVIALLFSRSLDKYGLRRFIAISILLLLIVVVITIRFDDSGNLASSIIVGIFVAGPIWTNIIYTSTSISLFRQNELFRSFRFEEGYGALAWLAAYITSWRFAVLETIEIYNALPTSPPPDCYIATAAARGHARFVRSESIELCSSVVRINPQLRYFKCGELALWTLLPAVHQVCRKVYDRVGCKLAGMIRCAFVADVVFVSLKPIEWCLQIVLKLMIPELDAFAHRVYASE